MDTHMLSALLLLFSVHLCGISCQSKPRITLVAESSKDKVYKRMSVTITCQFSFNSIEVFPNFYWYKKTTRENGLVDKQVIGERLELSAPDLLATGRYSIQGNAKYTNDWKPLSAVAKLTITGLCFKMCFILL